MRRGLTLIACLCAAWFAAGLITPVAWAENNGLALTPPMGWNDWYYAYCGVNAPLVEQTAQAMVSDGMKAAGYAYVNIDDCWMAASRDSAGNLVPDPTRFPQGIAPVAAYVHSLGLRLGLYEDAGTSTCAGLPGSYGHEAQDAATFASWGVDYLKYDRCAVPYADFPGQSQEQVQQTLYARMSAALAAAGRPIVFSMSNPDVPHVTPPVSVDPWLWGAPIANLWRTTTDIADNYAAMLANFEGTVGLYPYAGPGAWNDPDLLQVGNGGSSTLEYQAEFSLWAEMAAPLIASTNLSALSPADLAIYENHAVIAVDQDPLGKQGVPVSSPGGLWVMTKPLSGGARSVLLFNSTGAATTISTRARAVGLPGAPSYELRDLWTGNVSQSGGTISAFVPGHGVAMFVVTPLAGRKVVGLAPHTVLSISASPGTIAAGHLTTVTESFADQGTTPIKGITLAFGAAPGWRVGRLSTNNAKVLRPGNSFRVAYWVLAPSTGPPVADDPLIGRASYTVGTRPQIVGSTLGEQVYTTPTPPAPASRSARDG